jgi:prepilin-type N-terminal cleavage/methylation domain-containing protein/prepilin-type processing-associated H-X9-DG protein
MSRRRGFTLIELLVVIAIIAILAAILFPVFARAREKARQSACSSNVKQIGIALMQYLQDSDERYPPYYDKGTVSFCAPWCWATQVFPYVKNAQIFQCPSYPKPTGTFNVVGHPYFQHYALVGTGDNRPTYPQFLRCCGDQPIALPEVTEPTRSMLVVESSANKNNASYVTSGYGKPFAALHAAWGTYLPETINGDWHSTRHSDGSNVGFADGHVKWIANGDGKNWKYKDPTQ